MFKKILIITLLSTLFVNAEDLKVAAGAGYKKVLTKIINEYEKSGKKIDGFFGNMKQVSSQAKQTDIALVIGDKNFILNKSGLEVDSFITLGEGKVAIAYAKGIKPLNSSKDLLDKEIKKIAMPQPKKAIYGIAGEEFLKNENLYDKVKDRLYVVATVPQSLTYLITKEVDASIINLTAALENKDKIGGYIIVNSNSYSKIEIGVAKLKNCNEQCEEFIQFLQNEKSKEIFNTYGL
ncbi:molybdate ABC transporter substrate-binding protein [Halarcobacter ebronensis]|uniref:Molybdate ABC transporter substrate-binding protein n=1 Tax=Halarcobacter ebronensis TaxID=1462615 RepID=A0A4Q0YI54_9BACT|nr:molybdate ABC transporter substrate-binding protein [Halarcobacter ebronensis]RXJ68521.1 molybdate ABC transporter substrate-binding protein [Halarcobacter ebronensis]